MLGLITLAITSCEMPGYYAQKYSPPENRQEPLASPQPLQLEKQVEPHTCGYHAISTVYRAYGIDPAQSDLRFRLGVDQEAIPFDSTSLGSLHPDIYRVMAQDGFVIATIDPQSETAGDDLAAHLATGSPAIVLISRRENGNLHWVVFDKLADEQIIVYDPLFDRPYEEPSSSYLKNHVLSILLVSPSTSDTAVSVSEQHAAGIAEMRRVATRMP